MSTINALKHFISYSVYDRSRSGLDAEQHHEWVNQILSSHMVFISQELATEAVNNSPRSIQMMKDYLKEISRLVKEIHEMNQNLSIEKVNTVLVEMLENLLDALQHAVREVTLFRRPASLN